MADRITICGNIKIPEKLGRLVTTEKFDAQFFGIYKKICENMDPLISIVMECAYESIADAGINPRLLKGKNIAVFTGSGICEKEQNIDYELTEFSLIGNARALTANRISFYFGFQGPSANINNLCTSSASALEKGFFAIKNGEVEGAVICGGNLSLYPQLSLHLQNLGLLSPDGLTRSFDESANGFTRSEAVVAMFIQKACHAKRIYAEVKNVHSWNGPSYDRLAAKFPTSDFQTYLMKLTLKECGLTGKDISFVEADGLGVKEADQEEIRAIDHVYNHNRQPPLLIGSVKSNIGSCLAANTLVSIVKVITMMESGKIPPNIHYKQSSSNIAAIQQGRIKVVTEQTPWNGENVAINTTSFGGGFASVILKSFRKRNESGEETKDNLPRLIMVSGTTEDAVTTILDNMENKPFHSEMIQLINDIFEVENVSHLYRGYTLLSPQRTLSSKYREIQYISNDKREIWYIFSGMGSQWTGMGKALMSLPVFAESIIKCDAVLKHHGIDIMHILTVDDPNIFDNVINCFVGITVIQIGLVDFLTYLGVKPDYIIGHSLGEIGCAYADGCLTAEQAVLNAFYRGLASVETDLIKGSMAAIGLGYEEIKNLCPPDIDVACRNSADSTTISGPEDSIKKFIPILKAKQIFAKEVPCCNTAYHSRYITPVGSKLLEYLHKVIPVSKVRSPHWLSTSVPKSEWGTVRARLSSAEYYTNNLLNPVLFDDMIKQIPKEAITIEIAPHGLLQAILRRSLSPSIINIPLTRKYENNVEVMMGAIGRLYNNSGFKFEMTKLYPRLNYPVSSGTPSISSLIKWDHSITWSKSNTRFLHFKNERNENVFNIDLNDENWQFLKNYKIDNKIMLPISLYLKFALAVMKKFDKTETPVAFENIMIHENPYIDEDEVLKLAVMVQKGSGYFEATVDDNLLCSGILTKINPIETENKLVSDVVDDVNESFIGNDIYGEFHLRGYQFSKPFNSIYKINKNGSFGYVFSQKEWYLFLEGVLQMYMFGNERRSTQVPLKIRKFILNHENYMEQSKQAKAIPVSIDHKLNIIRTSGMELQGVQFKQIKQDSHENSTKIKEIKLISNTDEATISPKDFTKMVLQFLIENKVTGNIQLIRETLNNLETCLNWETIFEELLKTHEFEINSSSSLVNNKFHDIALQIFFDMSTLAKNNFSHTLKEGDFLLAILESPDENQIFNIMKTFDLGIVLKKRISNKQLTILFRKKRIFRNTCILEIADNITITDKLKDTINSKRFDRIILVTRKQNNGENLFEEDEIKGEVRYFEILDNRTQNISYEDPLYQNQLELDLKFNILTRDGKWGSRKCFSIGAKYNKTENSISRKDSNFLNWTEEFSENHDGKLLKVEYSTINEADVLLANGEIESYPFRKNCESRRMKRELKHFGQEYSGFNSKGTRLMGISGSGTLANLISIDSEFSWEVPNEWSLEEAVTVPLAYVTAYVALYQKCKIEKNKLVLIYDGGSAIGQAAINLALSEGAQVFTTYRTEDEKKCLKLQYLSLDENHLFSSKDPFEDTILSLTKGSGVDLIIYNRSNMSKIENCLRCIKKRGSFIIIDELQEVFGKSFGMFIFLNNVVVHSIIPHNLVNVDFNTKKEISSMMKDGLKRGVIKPIFSNLYSRDELKKALLDAGSKSYYGKTVIKVQPVDSTIGSLVIPRFSCLENRVYLLITDTLNNLFGIRLIDFLIAHGARDIIIASTTRKNYSNSLFNYHLHLWKKCETRIVFQENLDLSDNGRRRDLLNEALKLNPIDAIFDLQRMNAQNSRGSIDSFTKILFEETKKVCIDLRHFVVFTILKEANENLSHNLFRESNLITVCEERLNEGLPILLIIWGPMEECIQKEYSTRKANTLLTMSQCIQRLDYLMTLQSSIVVVNNSTTRSNEKIPTVVEKSKEELFKEYILE